MRGGGGGSRTPWKSGPAHEDDLDVAGRVGPGFGTRKKGAGVRQWLTVDSAGQAQVVEAEKHSIMRRTGLPARDLRILDPLLSYPSTVLGRERAIVINLEHIKAIITAHEVLLLNSKDPAVAPFVHELQSRLHHHHHHHHHRSTSADHHHHHHDQEGRTGGNVDWANVYDLEEPRSGSTSPPLGSGNLNYSGALPSNPEVDEKGKEDAKPSLVNSGGPRVLPFEFVALEACLEAACSCLENEAITLEKEAHPALDKLTSKISTLNLERVRQIKSRLVAITGRVQKVRDELEHLLDDDDDMAEMYLTDKLLQQQLSDASSSHSSLNVRGEGMDDERIPTEISSEENDVKNNYDDDSQNIENQDRLLSGSNMINGDGHETHTCSSTRSSSKHHDVEELEMLLEAYFVQIDGTLNKLSTLREYVDDTEDYINIMLDDKQNHLLQMGVMLTTATLIISAFVVLVGIFGMNIQVELFDEKKSGMPEFLWTVGGGTTGSILLYVVAIAWCKHRRLLE